MSCRDSNVRGCRGGRGSRWVGGEVEGEAVEATFLKGARQKIKRQHFWTAPDLRLMWTDQAKFWHSIRYQGETSLGGGKIFLQILDLAVVVAHFLQKRTKRKFLSISYEKIKRKFVHRYRRRSWERFVWDAPSETASALSDPTDSS